MNIEGQPYCRRSLRLKNYNYSRAGAYFVTICTHNRALLFGEVAQDEMRLNGFGKIVRACWDDLPRHYSHLELDEFIIMPNHVHGIIVLNDPGHVGAGLRPAPTDAKRHGLSEVVRAFKSFSARRVNEIRRMAGTPVWQRNYFEHIIRNANDLDDTRRYIANNPLQWLLDEVNPSR